MIFLGHISVSTTVGRLVCFLVFVTTFSHHLYHYIHTSSYGSIASPAKASFQHSFSIKSTEKTVGCCSQIHHVRHSIFLLV